MASYAGSLLVRVTMPLSRRPHGFLLAVCLLWLSNALLAQTAHFSGAQITLPSTATYPFGLAVDTSGNVWVADNYDGTVSEVTKSAGVYTQSTPIMGLNGPYGIAIDSQGNLYITEDGASEGGNDVVKETLVPSPFGNTYVQSVLPTNGLSRPYGIAVDAHGVVYIADGDNNRIVEETPSGSSYTQATLPTSRLSIPSGVALDSAGNLYIADTFNSRVLKETVSGTHYKESIVAGQLARTPWAVSVDGGGNVYILAFAAGTFSEDYFVVKESPSAGGYTQSTVSFTPYQNPYGMAADASGNLYIESPGGSRLEKLVPGAADFGPVHVGAASSPISLIFTLDAAGTLGSPAVLTQGLTGLDFVQGANTCATQGSGYVYPAGEVCSMDVLFKPRSPGIHYGGGDLTNGNGTVVASAYVYGTGLAPQVSFLPARTVAIAAQMQDPHGVAVDAQGNVFVSELGTGTLFRESRSGSGFAQTPLIGGLSHPAAVAVDGIGNLYVAAGNTVYKETHTQNAGNYSLSVLLDNFSELSGIAVDGKGNLYITSSASGDVHKETLAADGTYTESGIGFGIAIPGGIAVDGFGNVFVTDPRQGEVYKETLEPNGTYRQSTLAGGLADPESLALDGGGNVYVVASAPGQIYKEALQADGTYVQTIFASGLNSPRGIALDFQGNLYVTLDVRGQLAMIDVTDPPVLSFAKTGVGLTSADSPRLVTVSNIGNTPLDIPFPGSGATNPMLTSGFTLASATTCPEIDSSAPNGTLAPGASCVFAIDFVPGAIGAVRGSLALFDNNLNLLSAKQSIELREGITNDATRTSVRVTPAQIKRGLGVTLTITVSDTSTLSIVPQGGSVSFTDTVLGQAVALNGGQAVPLVKGKAALTMSPRVTGRHTITAHYSGVDAHYAGSTGTAPMSVFK